MKKDDTKIKKGKINKEENSLKKVSFFGKIKYKLKLAKTNIKAKFKLLKSMKKTELITKIFSTRYFYFFMFLVILLKTMLFSVDTVFYKHGIWLWYIRQTAFFIIIMLAPMFLFRSSRGRFIYGMLLNLFVSILLFADELYYSYAQNIISVVQAGNLQYKDEIISAIPSLLHIRQILYFIDFIVVFGLLISKTVKVEKIKDFKLKPLLVMSVCVLVLCSYYHFVPESLELVTGFIYNKQNSVRYGTIYGYHFVDVKNMITNNKNTKYDTYDEMIEDYDKYKEEQIELNLENAVYLNAEALEKNQEDDEFYLKINEENENYSGIANGKNVIVLQLESVQNFVVDKTINGKEITPVLNDFLEENIDITNMHATSYTTTADSEHSVITSLYPLENGEAFSKYYGNTYDDIFKEFKNAGYYTMYAHGNDAYFWNRENVMSKLLVDETQFLDDFEDTSELISTYLSDELLYKQTVDYFEKAVIENEKVFYNIVAASSHKPFELSGIQNKSEKISIDVGELKDTEFGRYLEAINYADYAFGIFIDLLKEKGLYDDTVILVFGDHYGMQMYDEDLRKYLGYDNQNTEDVRLQFEFSNVLCGIRIPGIENIKINAPVSKNDIKPTLAEICGLEDTFSMGMNMFDRNSYVAINNGKIITRDYYYDGNNWFYLENGKELDMDSISEEEKKKLEKYKENTILELDISKSVVINNLLKDRF